MKHQIVVNYPGCIAPKFEFDASDSISVKELLEQIYAWFNHGSGREADIFLNSKMRSLSVFDFVRLDGVWFQCRGTGWDAVTDEYVDEIEKAVVNHPKFKLHGGFSALNEVMWEKFKRIS